jgi:hypothetical protein
MNTICKAPANVIMLIIATARQVLISDPALAVKRVHVVNATTKATGWHHHLNDMRIEAGDFLGVTRPL